MLWILCSSSVFLLSIVIGSYGKVQTGAQSISAETLSKTIKNQNENTTMNSESMECQLQETYNSLELDTCKISTNESSNLLHVIAVKHQYSQLYKSNSKQSQRNCEIAIHFNRNSSYNELRLRTSKRWKK